MTVPDIKADFVALARDYPDRWVALHPDTGAVVAVGSSAREVLDAAVRDGVDEPLITKALPDYSAYVLCLIG